MRFNTAISQMMILSNHLQGLDIINIETLKTFLLLLNPFIPHMAEELNAQMNAFASLSYTKWPEFDEKLAKEDLVTIAIQVNGKLRGSLKLPAETDDKTLKTEAAKVDGVKKHLEGKNIVKKIIIPGRLVNFVAK
jgi:leucyl-tRNA synthetase